MSISPSAWLIGTPAVKYSDLILSGSVGVTKALWVLTLISSSHFFTSLVLPSRGNQSKTEKASYYPLAVGSMS
jgi:hypothetical protein